MEMRSLIFNFADAIQRKRLVLLKFKTLGDGQMLQRKCAPLDIAPSRRSKTKNNKFHLWDFESCEQNHVLSINPDQIIDFKILDEQFKPEDFITWDTLSRPWSVKRDWGTHS